MRVSLLVVTSLVLFGCSSVSEPNVVGNWGGTEASLALTAAGGSLSYQCGAGTVDSSWSLNDDGQFTASGLHYFGGGPVPAQGRPPHPARYTGRVQGERFVLTVTVTDVGQTLGPFSLTRGGPVVSELCV